MFGANQAGSQQGLNQACQSHRAMGALVSQEFASLPASNCPLLQQPGQAWGATPHWSLSMVFIRALEVGKTHILASIWRAPDCGTYNLNPQLLSLTFISMPGHSNVVPLVVCTKDLSRTRIRNMNQEQTQ